MHLKYNIIVITLLLILVAPLSAIDYHDMPIAYGITQNTKECIVCGKKDQLVLEDSLKGYWTIRCTNPDHYPYFLVMASGLNPDEAIKTWNSRGRH